MPDLISVPARLIKLQNGWFVVSVADFVSALHFLLSSLDHSNFGGGRASGNKVAVTPLPPERKPKGIAQGPGPQAPAATSFHETDSLMYLLRSLYVACGLQRNKRCIDLWGIPRHRVPNTKPEELLVGAYSSWKGKHCYGVEVFDDNSSLLRPPCVVFHSSFQKQWALMNLSLIDNDHLRIAHNRCFDLSFPCLPKLP